MFGVGRSVAMSTPTEPHGLFLVGHVPIKKAKEPIRAQLFPIEPIESIDSIEAIDSIGNNWARIGPNLFPIGSGSNMGPILAHPQQGPILVPPLTRANIPYHNQMGCIAPPLGCISTSRIHPPQGPSFGVLLGSFGS